MTAVAALSASLWTVPCLLEWPRLRTGRDPSPHDTGSLLLLQMGKLRLGLKETLTRPPLAARLAELETAPRGPS